MRRITLIKVIIIILLSTTLVSCNKGREERELTVGKKEKAPKSLISISGELDRIFTSVGEIEKIMDLSPLELETLKSKEKGKEEKENKEGENKEKENKGEDQKKEAEEDTEKKPKEDKDEKSEKEERAELKNKELFEKWYDIDKTIEKVHREWNDYEVEAMKKVVKTEKTKEFKENLNSYTIAIENRNIKKILDTGSQVILSLSSFFDLYKDEINGDLSRIKHAAYQANLIGETNVKGAKKLLDSTGEYITRLRSKLADDKEDANRLDKLALAIEDMKQSLKEGNRRLLEIKRDIIINNIKLLEKQIGGKFDESRSNREVLLAKRAVKANQGLRNI